MGTRQRASLLATIALVAAACDSTKLHEARTLARALEQFSLATPADRPRALDSLESVTVTDPSLSSAKTQCIAYARRLHEALTLKDEVALRLGDVRAGLIEKSDPIAISLPTKLDRAETLLKEAQVLHRQCRRSLTEAGAP
jgi:hypothetical protein